MAPYFGGHQADPQGVVIKDNSTGFLGFGRNTVTATSILSDTIWGLALPEIWCNSDGNPLFAFVANALMVAYRDESDYADSLGILGAGPIGGFTGMYVVTNADGYRYVVAPMVDGYTPQGFKVDGNLNVQISRGRRSRIPCTTWTSGRNRWTWCPRLCRRCSIRCRSVLRGRRTRCKLRPMTRSFRASGRSIPISPMRSWPTAACLQTSWLPGSCQSTSSAPRGRCAGDQIDLAVHDGWVVTGQRNIARGHLRNRLERASFGSV